LTRGDQCQNTEKAEWIWIKQAKVTDRPVPFRLLRLPKQCSAQWARGRLGGQKQA